jgi:hypothetical protein
MHTLCQILFWLDDVQAIFEAKTLDHILGLLNSLSPDVRKWTCRLVGRLAGHESTAPAVLQLKPCERLVSLLR